MYPYSINKIDDKLIWKFIPDGDFLVKTATWANNNTVPPLPKAKLLNSLWKLNLRPNLQLFDWKFLREILHTGNKIKRLGINIDGNCPFCNKGDETLNHLFSTYELALNVWSITETNCPISINSSLYITTWIDFIWSCKKFV